MVNIYQGLKEEQKDKILFKLKGNKIRFYEKESYIYELDGKIIGYFNLTPISGCLNIDAEILEEFRGKGLGNEFLENISNYVASKCIEYNENNENNEIEYLLLLIEPSNISAIKTAEKNGYSLDYTLFDGDVENELSGTSSYTKSIKNCKEKKR